MKIHHPKKLEKKLYSLHKYLWNRCGYKK